MSDPTARFDSSIEARLDALTRSLEDLVGHWSAERAARSQFEQDAIAVLGRIAAALERGGPAIEVGGSAIAAPDSTQTEVRAAINEGRWDRAQAIVDGRAVSDPNHPHLDSLRIELTRARDRATADLSDRIAAAREANDATGALAARDELSLILHGEDLKEVDRSLVAWLMKLIQRRLRSIPVGADLAALATEIANRFGGTSEGASLRAALPTLRRSAGLCPRCSEPYLGVDDACPKCLALAGQAPAATPTLTFVTDDLDAVVSDAGPIDLNNAEIWKLP